jgi:hypothetical protein
MRWWKLPHFVEPYGHAPFLLLSLPLPVRSQLGSNGEYRDAWGGPTLAGAWAAHALGAIASWLLALWVLRGWTARWRRIAST